MTNVGSTSFPYARRCIISVTNVFEAHKPFAGKQHRKEGGGGDTNREPRSPQLSQPADSSDFSSPYWRLSGIYVTVPFTRASEPDFDINVY